MKNFKNCVKNTEKIDFLRIFSYFLLIFLIFFNKYDLKLSRLLADLQPYQYYSDNKFAIFFELYGEYILYFFVSVAVFYVIFYLLFYKQIKNNILMKKLFLFALIIIFVGIFSNLITHIFKQFIFGRMRYRAMNLINDFSYFTPFYILNGQSLVKQFAETTFSHDAFRSFPSGHVTACSILFVMFLLPILFKNLPKWLNVLCYLFPVLFTSILGISRIIAGAHFMSDILAAMLIVLLFVIIGRSVLSSKMVQKFIILK